jgi:PPM family protein phosphatase
MHPPSSTPIAQNLRWFGYTDRGKIRSNNEDSFLGLQFNARELHHLGKFGDAQTEQSDFAFAVSDGMGGAMAGEFASRITVEKVTRLLPPSFKQSAAGIEVGYDDILGELFQQIHASLTHLGESYQECSGMGATLSLCWFTPGWMYFAHIGDSRIYYLSGRDDGIKQLSHDDTHVGWLFRNGKLNEREARNHPRRNVLQKSLGAGNQFVDPQLGAVVFEPGDRFLLCTDGITDGLYDRQLADLLRAPSATEAEMSPAERLVRVAVNHSGRDNTTALVIEAH